MSELRIAVVFRADLPEMTRGKAEVQFGHAIAACLLDSACPPDLARQYMGENQAKLSLETDSADSLMELVDKAQKRGVPFAVITDAGRTCFDGPTVTCIGIGPMNKTDCNAITRGTRMR